MSQAYMAALFKYARMCVCHSRSNDDEIRRIRDTAIFTICLSLTCPSILSRSPIATDWMTYRPTLNKNVFFFTTAIGVESCCCCYLVRYEYISTITRDTALALRLFTCTVKLCLVQVERKVSNKILIIALQQNVGICLVLLSRPPSKCLFSALNVWIPSLDGARMLNQRFQTCLKLRAFY